MISIYKLAKNVLWLFIFAAVVVVSYRQYTALFPSHWDEIAVKHFECKTPESVPNCNVKSNLAVFKDVYLGQTIDGKYIITLYNKNEKESKNLFEKIIIAKNNYVFQIIINHEDLVYKENNQVLDSGKLDTRLKYLSAY